MSEDKQTFGKPEVNRVIEAFTNHWGMKPTPEKLQRRYANMLVKEYGERTDDLVKYALDIQKEYYAPVITSPKDLYYKRLNVTAYWRKNNETKQGGVLEV